VKSHHSPLSSTVPTTSNPHLGTVSGRVTLVMDSVVQLLKMIGCVVLAVLPETGVPTTSNLDQEVVNGVMANAVRSLGAEQAVVIEATEDGVRMAVAVSYLSLDVINIG